MASNSIPTTVVNSIKTGKATVADATKLATTVKGPKANAARLKVLLKGI